MYSGVLFTRKVATKFPSLMDPFFETYCRDLTCMNMKLMFNVYDQYLFCNKSLPMMDYALSGDLVTICDICLLNLVLIKNPC